MAAAVVADKVDDDWVCRVDWTCFSGLLTTSPSGTTLSTSPSGTTLAAELHDDADGDDVPHLNHRIIIIIMFVYYAPAPVRQVKIPWYSKWSLGGVLISLCQAIEPVGWYTTESVTHGQCDARPTVTFTANGRYQFIPVSYTHLTLPTIYSV